MGMEFDKEYMYIHIHVYIWINESLCCTPETNTTYLANYAPI